MQEQEKVRDGSTIKETTKAKQETVDESEDLLELVECFKRNSAGSVCPNTAKGIFVNLEEIQGFFRRL